MIPKVLVIGDVGIDRYLWTTVTRISPEAPIPVARIDRETATLGCAGNVALNLKSLGADVFLVGGAGNDPESSRLQSLLDAHKIPRKLFIESGFQTIQKTRILAQNQQMLRVDRESESEKNSNEMAVLEWIGHHIARFDAVILSDYEKGFLTAKICAAAISEGRKILVDPRPAHRTFYADADFLTPNRREAEMMIHEKITPETLETSLEKLGKLFSGTMVLTRGADGISVRENSGQRFDISAIDVREVFDVSGAGDTVIAVLAYFLAKNFPLKKAAEIANTAGGIVVQKVGTATVSRADLEKYFPHDELF